MAQQKIELDIPDDLKPRQRLELADLIIEHIVDRTDRGLDKNGRKFPPYSRTRKDSKGNIIEGYIDSLDFKNAGKSPNRVNLQLTGDMLAALDILNHKKGKLVIGYEKGTEENDKAEGNILGSYGGEPNKKKARDFLGLQKEKLRELIRYVKENG